MKVSLRGEELNLKFLDDSELYTAQRLAKNSGVPLDHCPTCGARETTIPGSGGIKEFVNGSYRLLGEEHPCDCQAQMALRARYLLANIGEQFMRLDWNEFDGSKAARSMVAAYIERWKNFRQHGWGLEFGGPLGVGKTFAATHIGKELIKRNQRVFFLSFKEMLSLFEKENGERVEDQMRDTTFLILDEILPPSSSREHNFFSNKLEALIRHRTNHNLPTIITTNLTEAQLTEHYPRTYSLLAAKQERVEMTGDDQRLGRIPTETVELIQNGEIRPIS